MKTTPSGSKPIWKSLEHRIKAELEFLEIAPQIHGKKLAVCISGGADSVALAHVLFRLSVAMGFELRLAHFHHGQGVNLDYRDRCVKFCQGLAESMNLPIHLAKHQGEELRSEADLREARWQFLKSVLADGSVDFLLTAHHAEDQLETRILNLIRGCGPSGLSAMNYLEGQILRPFLNLDKSELYDYLKELPAEFVEDPSNLETEFRRNWIRQDWLPNLEQKIPGATKAFARSLELISEAFQQQQEIKGPLSWYQGQWEKGLDRTKFYTFSRAEQRQVLVDYLKLLGTHDFRHTQVEEIIKNIDKPQISHTFKLLRLEWQVNAEQILALH